MATKFTNPNVGYGLSSALPNLAPLPIVARRAPGTSDFAEIGSTWIDTTADAVYVITSIANGAAVWSTSPASGVGTFTSVVVNPGDLDVQGAASTTTISSGTVNLDNAAGTTTIAGDLTIAGTTTINGDLDLTSAALIDLTSTLNAAPSISLTANGGTSEQILLNSVQGTASDSISLLSDAGGITLTSTVASADGVVVNANNGGFHVDADLLVNITGRRNNAQAILLESTLGGIDVLASGGAAGEDIDITATSSSVNIIGGEAAVLNAVRLQASAADGGIDIDCGTGGITIDSTGAFSIDGAAASNVTTTGAGVDLTLSSALGSVLVRSTEDAALAIRLHANGGTSETIQLHSDQGTGVGSINLLSDVGGITLTATGLASADAINLEATAGGIDMDAALQINIASSQNAADAIRIISSAGGIDVDAVGAAGEDINITNTGGSVVISATESAADSIVIQSTAGGIDILASGAAAGEDIDITATGSSVNITATEATADAIVLNSSNAAGGIDLLTGGGEITISSSGNVTMAPGTDTQASPTATATINARVFKATFTGFTTASSGTQAFTITNSTLGAGDAVILTVANRGSNDAQMTLRRVNTQTAGTIVVNTFNSGAAALNGDVVITGWILD